MHTQPDTTRSAPRWRWWSTRPRAADPAPPAGAPIGPDGTVARDLPCRRCGYNLRTLNADAACPECALPVAASAHGDALLYSDPAWLSKITLGADLLVFGWVAIVPTMVSIFILPFIAGVLMFVTVAALLIGTWLLARPDPSGSGEGAYGRSRKLARFLPLAALAVPYLDELRRAFPSNTPGTELVSTLIASAVYAGEWASLGAVLAMLSYLQSLAATRLLDADLATRCIKVSAQLLGGGIVCLALNLAERFVTAPASLRTNVAVSALANLYLLVAVARHVGILIHFRGKLHRQLDLAREAWSSATRAAVTTSATPT